MIKKKIGLSNVKEIDTIGTDFILRPGYGFYYPENEQLLNLLNNPPKYVGVVLLNKQQCQKLDNYEIKDCLLGVTIKDNNPLQYWNNNYQQYQNYAEKFIKVVHIQINMHQNQFTKIMDFIRHLQNKNLWVVCQLKFKNENYTNPKIYQLLIAKFTQQLISRQKLYLPGISLQLNTLSNQLQNYILLTLGIWRRTIPVSIGSIIIQQFINKTIFKMHFIKQAQLAWPIQFITNNKNNCKGLALEALGVQ